MMTGLYVDFPRGNTKFIRKAKAAHKNKDILFTLCNYIDDKTPVTLVCKKHGPFTVNPKEYLITGSGCPNCNNAELHWTRQKLMQYLHLRKFDSSVLLSSGSRFTVQDSLELKCAKHGIYSTTISSLISRAIPCTQCQKLYEEAKLPDSNKMDKDKFIIQAIMKYSHKYSYEHVVFSSVRELVKITCSVHGDFLRTPAYFLNGNECPGCIRDARRAAFSAKNLKMLNDLYPTFTFSYKDAVLYNHTIVRAVCPNNHAVERAFKVLVKGTHKCLLCEKT